MSLSHTLARFSLAALLLCAASAVEASTVTCESKGGAYTSCPANTSEGVRLSRQLSSQGCWQDDTWGYDRNRIWVNNGCRAEFQVGKPASSSAGAGDAVAAAAIVGIAAAAVIASNNDNDHHNHHDNHNYTYDDRYDDEYFHRYPEYDHGRSYEHSRYGYNGYGGNPRETFSCESTNGHRSTCSIPRHGHVEIYRQRSSSRCTYGRSWGVNGNRVWVDDGCRAEFAVY